MACALRCLEAPFQHNTKISRQQNRITRQGIRTISARRQLDGLDSCASEDAYFPLLKICQQRESLHEARQVYAQLVKQGELELNPLLCDDLAVTLVKCGGFEDAHYALCKFPSCTSSSSWTVLVSAYIRCSQCCNALQVYRSMLENGVQPNSSTFVCLFKACGSILNLEEGRKLHSDAHERGFSSDVYVGSSLVSMYGKCNNVAESENVFYLLPERNAVSWNAMLSSYIGKDEEKALRLYRQMQEEEVSPNHLTFVSVLKACSILAEKKSSLDASDVIQKRLCFQEIGEALHADTRRMFFAANAFVGNTLISMYGKCKCFSQAENVFSGLLSRNIVSWNIILSAYLEQNQALIVLHLYVKLHEEGVSPDHETFMIVLQACYNLEVEDLIIDGLRRTISLEICQAIQVDVLRKGFSSDVIIASMLISIYSKHNNIAEAETIFTTLLEPDVISWNAMFSAYVKHKQEEKVLILFSELLKEGICPDEQTFVVCFQACSGFAGKEKFVLGIKSTRFISLEVGRAIHAYARRKGAASSILMSNTLISMYGKCGAMVEANNVFNAMQEHDIISWNALLSAYVECSEGHLALQLYCQMHDKGMMPDKLSLATALQACGTSADKIEPITLTPISTKVIFLKCGWALHVDAQLKGFDSDNFVEGALLSMYCKCGTLTEAENIFLASSKQNVVLWNIMISAYVEHGKRNMALQLYQLMRGQCVCFNERTIVLALKACCLDTDVHIDDRNKAEMCLEIGRAVHKDASKNGFMSNIFVASALIGLYGKCGCIREAEHVFDQTIERNVIVWNSILATYLENGEGLKTLQLYKEMQQAGVSPDPQTFVTALQACCVLAEKEAVRKAEMPMEKISLKIGQALHADAIRFKGGVAIDGFVGSALVSMYGKCGSVCEAEAMFHVVHDLDAATWNAMIYTYVEHHLCEKAMILYTRMNDEGLTINDTALMCMLQASTEAGSLEMCQQIHFTIVHSGSDCCPLLSTSLIHACGSSACMTDAEAVFDAMCQADVAAWSSFMAGFGRQGNYEASITVLEEMRVAGIAADEMTYCSFLFSCSHTGNVSKGVECFESIIRGCAVTPKLWHYTSMLDLFGRAGDRTKIDALLQSFPMQADLAIWLSLLSACCIHANLDFAEHAFTSAVNLQPREPAGNALMSNIYRQFNPSPV